MMRVVLAIVILLLGVCLAVGGVWLIVLGGSWGNCILAAIGFLGAGALLLQRRPLALAVYALVVACTLVWAVHEVGFDWWQLAPRGGVIVLLGILLLLPWVTRDLDPVWARRWQAVWSGAAWPLAVALVASLGVAGYSMIKAPHSVDGVVPERAASSLPESESRVPPGEWACLRPHRRRQPLFAARRDNAGERGRVRRLFGTITLATCAAKATRRRPRMRLRRP